MGTIFLIIESPTITGFFFFLRKGLADKKYECGPDYVILVAGCMRGLRTVEMLAASDGMI